MVQGFSSGSRARLAFLSAQKHFLQKNDYCQCLSVLRPARYLQFLFDLLRKSLAEVKDEYEKVFREYFLQSFSSRLAEYSNPIIQVDSKKKINENYTIVSSTLAATEKRPSVKIEWRVYTKNQDQPLIRDLIIEGLSLARTQKEEFNSIIQSADGDLNALLENLRNFSNAS